MESPPPRPPADPSTALMETESKEESETGKKAPRLRRKAGLKFAPKASSNSAPKTIPKKEPHEEGKVAAIDKELMLKLRTLKNSNALGSRAKAEKKETPIQVAFGQANPSVPRTFHAPRSSSSGLAQDAPGAKLPKKYDDPWVYSSTNYPVTLPLRRPYSGDPDLDEDEFRQSSSKAHDAELTSAEELGLMDRMDEPQLLFFQLPHSLPLQRQSDLAAEADTDTNVDVSAKLEGGTRKRRPYLIHGCKLRELPGGLMGKMLVYKSGKVKMKLGDVHFDVSAGSNRPFAQEAVVVDTKEKLFSSLGDVGKVAIVTHDIDYLLDCIKME